MPNIAITTYCNLHCPYCFAGQMIQQEDIQNITTEQLQNILNWLKTSKYLSRIGIIGGEPTLHPSFNEILNIIYQFCQEKNINTILFTNGIYIDKILNNFPKNLHILININTPKAMTKPQYYSLISNLNTIQDLKLFNTNITLGCNICQQINNYDFFWNIIDQYMPIKKVRVSVTAPTQQKWLNQKEEYYNSLKEKFLDFLNEAKKRNIQLGLDCNQIPKCYFSNDEYQLLFENSDIKDRYLLCSPVIDITPDFKATSCFGTYDPIDCTQFPNYDALYNYCLYKKNVQLTLANIQGKCATCKEHELLLCQGGCLAFAQSNLKSISI